MMKMTKKLSLFFFSTLTLTSCGPGHDRAQNVSSSTMTGILGGTDVESTDSFAPYVVGLLDEDKGSLCTGSLIAVDIVLTAAHCVNPGSKRLWVVFGKEFESNGRLNRTQMVAAKSFVQHPEYDIKKIIGQNAADVALVHFEGGLRPSYKTVSLSSDVDTVATQGQTLMAAGFGVTNGIFNWGSGTLRKLQLQFKQMHSETEFQTEQFYNRGVCSGDSGGPLFQLKGTDWVQVGIASRVGTKFLSCRGFAVYTRVDTFAEWITETSQKLRAGSPL